MKLLKVSIGVQRYQVSFETMFGLIWVKIWALEAQKVFPADSTPPPPPQKDKHNISQGHQIQH